MCELESNWLVLRIADGAKTQLRAMKEVELAKWLGNEKNKVISEMESFVNSVDF